MKKIHKQLITGLLALSLVTPLAMTGLTNQNNPISTSVVSAKSRLVKLPFNKLNRYHKKAVRFWLREANRAKRRAKKQDHLKFYGGLHRAKAYSNWHTYKLCMNKAKSLHYERIPIRRHRIRRSHQHLHYRKYEVDTEEGLDVTNNWHSLASAVRHDKDYRTAKVIPAWATFYGARMSKFDEPVYHIHYHGHWYWYTEDAAKSDGHIGDPGF